MEGRQVKVKDLLHELMRAVGGVAPHEIPPLLGDLEALKAILWGRILHADGKAEPPEHDTLLDAQQVSERLRCSLDYVYRSGRKWPFAVRIGRRLLFSSSGLEAWIRRRQGR